MDNKLGKMEPNITASGKMARCKVKAILFIQTKILMRASSIRMRQMEQAYLRTIMVKSIKASGFLTNPTEKENSIIKMDLSTKVILGTEQSTDMECIFGQVILQFIKDNGEMMNLKVMVILNMTTGGNIKGNSRVHL